MTTGKIIALTRWTFFGKVMSLLFNMLSRLVINSFPRSKCLLISWLQSASAVILEPNKIVSHCFHCFPIYLPWSDGTRCHDLRFFECWVSALASFLPKKSQGWSSEWTDWISLQSQGTRKSLLQHHSSKASILRHSSFFIVQLSHPYKTILNF